MYALCVSGAVNTHGFVWTFFYALYINFHSFIHLFTHTEFISIYSAEEFVFLIMVPFFFHFNINFENQYKPCKMKKV